MALNSTGGISDGAWWSRQEGHNKKSCRTANDNRSLVQGDNSDTGTATDTERMPVAEAIVVEIPIRRRGNRLRRRR